MWLQKTTKGTLKDTGKNSEIQVKLEYNLKAIVLAN